MIKNKVTLACIAIGTLLLAGCIEPTVMPHGNNSYTVVSLANSETQATDAAMKKATKVCAETGKQAIVTKNSSNYQGVDKNDKAVFGLAGDILNVVSKGKGGASRSEQGDDDNKVTIDFRCE